MFLGAAWNSIFSRDRQRTGYESERVHADEPEGGTIETSPANESEPSLPTDSESTDPERTISPNQGASVDENEARVGRRTATTAEDGATDENVESFSGFFDRDYEPTEQLATRPVRENNVTIAELEEQRELSRRRSSACVLLAVFVLFRLWIECIQTQDPTLILLCLFATSWMVRWIRYNREREEELERRIENFMQNNNNNNVADRNDFARLSFQAQLALAIMESQRHMMEGGYGRPEGYDNHDPGVSDQAKARWKTFQWKQATSKKGDYGALPKGADVDQDNHCSICLGEYEDSDTLIQLPCQHIYHDECIQSWTSNHVKCPLCNMDLELAATVENQSIV